MDSFNADPFRPWEQFLTRVRLGTNLSNEREDLPPLDHSVEYSRRDNFGPRPSICVRIGVEAVIFASGRNWNPLVSLLQGMHHLRRDTRTGSMHYPDMLIFLGQELNSNGICFQIASGMKNYFTLQLLSRLGDFLSHFIAGRVTSFSL